MSRPTVYAEPQPYDGDDLAYMQQMSLGGRANNAATALYVPVRAGARNNNNKRSVDRFLANDDTSFDPQTAAADDTDLSSSASSSSSASNHRHTLTDVVIERRVRTRQRSTTSRPRARRRMPALPAPPPPRPIADGGVNARDQEHDEDECGDDDDDARAAPGAAPGAHQHQQPPVANAPPMLPSEEPMLAPEWGELVQMYGTPIEVGECRICEYQHECPPISVESLAAIGAHFDAKIGQAGAIAPVINAMRRMGATSIRLPAMQSRMAALMRDNGVAGALGAVGVAESRRFLEHDTHTCAVHLRRDHEYVREAHALLEQASVDNEPADESDVRMRRYRIMCALFERVQQEVPDWSAQEYLWHYVMHEPSAERVFKLMQRGTRRTALNTYIYSAHTRSADGSGGVVASSDGWSLFDRVLRTARNMHDPKMEKQLGAWSTQNASSDLGARVQQQVNTQQRPTYVRCAHRLASVVASTSHDFL